MKNGMQMLLESLLPPDTLQAVQKAATDIPAIAQRIGAQLDRIEAMGKMLDLKIDAIDALVRRIEDRTRGDNPPEETPLSQLATTLPALGDGSFPPSLKRMVESDG